VGLYCSFRPARDWAADAGLAHALREPAAGAAPPAPARAPGGDALDAGFARGADGLYARRENGYVLFNEPGARSAAQMT